MFEKLITTVLNKVLGDFIENIDPGQLKISITNGKVKLANMKLKATLFNSLPVPFQLDYGQVGLINLTIPIWNMFSSPLIIEIEDVFGVIRPKRMDEWKEEVEIKNFRANTQDTLDRFEVFQSNAESLKKKDPSSVDKLVAKIIDNLQITIKNVYFRYEDSYSAVNQGSGRFAVGVMLKELSAFTTNQTWTEKIMITGSEITYKLGIIKGLTVFLDYDQQKQPAISMVDDPVINLDKLNSDATKTQFRDVLNQEFVAQSKPHKYILHNFALEARLELNNQPKVNKRPQVKLNLILGGSFKNIEDGEQKDLGINFSVHQPQIVRILKLLEYIGYYNEFQRGSLAELYKNKVTSEVSRQYVNLYCEWKVMETKKDQDKATIKSKKEEMRQIEDNYTADKLIVLRKFAMKLFDKEAEKIKKQEEIEKEVKKAKKEKKGWGLFMSKEKKQKIKGEVEELRNQLQSNLAQEHENIQNEFDNELMELTASLSNEQFFETDDFQTMPSDYIRFIFAVHLPAMRLQLINEFDQTVFIAAIEGSKLMTKLGDGITKVKFKLNSITLADHWCQSKVFPNVIETKELPDKNKESAEDVLMDKTKINALKVKFEQNKNFTISPFKVQVTTEKTLFVVVNFSFIKEVQRTVASALENETFDFTFYREAASEKAIGYMQTGKALIEQLKKGEYTHQALDISLYLSAPVFIVPQSIYDPTQPCIIADTGILDLQSKLVKYEQGKDYKLEKNPKHLYDVYEAKLHDLQIIIMDRGLDGISSYDEHEGNKLIKDFDAKLYFFNCFEPMHPKFPTAELSVVIENVHLVTGIGNLQIILQVVNTIQNTMNAKEFQFFDAAIEEHKVKLEKSVSQMLGEKIKEKIENYRKKQPQDTDESDIQDEDDLKEQLHEDADQFFELIKENLSKKDVKKVAKKQQKVEEEKQKIREDEGIEEVPTLQVDTGEKLMTNFKIYAQVNKIQFTFQDQELIFHSSASDFLNIALSGLELEIEIDRKEDINISLNVLKFVIQDVSEDSKIAKTFRLILSSPLAEAPLINDDEFMPPDDIQEVVPKKRLSSSKKSSNQQWVHENQKPATRLITGSLLLGTDQDDFDEGFQDAISEEEEQIFNEFDLRIVIKKEKTSIVSNLTDMRLLFSVPTVEKLVKNVMRLQDMLEGLEDQALEDRMQMIEKYELVIENLKKDFQDPEQNLIKKVFVNHSKARDIDPLRYKDIYMEGVNKMSMVWEKQTITEKVEEQAKQKAKSWIRRRLKTVKEEVESKLDLRAALNNFSVWVPLNAENEKSQILSLSFLSVFSLEQNSKELKEIDKKFDQVIKKEKLQSDSILSLQINHFTIEMLTSNDYLRTLRQSYKMDFNDEEPYSSSQLLTPCRVTVTVKGMVRAQEQYLKNDINVGVEPVYMRVGFKDIDFINVIYVQLDQNILKQLKQKEQTKNETQELKRKATISHLKSDFVDDDPEITDLLKSPSKIDIMRNTKRQQEQQKKASKKAQKKFQDPEKAYLQVLNVVVNCEVVTLALSDDTENVNVNLVHVDLQGLRFRMKQNNKPENEATYILTKMGIQQKLHKEYSKLFRHLEMKASFDTLKVDYYNQKSLAFEPLLEPWLLDFELNQEAPYVEQVMAVKSDRFLSVNLTFGMALTIRRIMDRVQESLKSAKIIDKLNKQIPLTVEEIEFSEQWHQKFGKRGSITKYKDNQMGFIFQNFTGLPLKFIVSDDTLNDELRSEDAQKRLELLNESGLNESRMPMLTLEKVFELPARDPQETQFCTYDELYGQQREIHMKRTIGKSQASLFEERQPIKLDFKIGPMNKLVSVPIEALGVYSYVAEYSYIPDNVSTSTFGGSKKSKVTKKIGVVVNIKMEGMHKRVSVESQLLIANNNSKDVVIFVCASNQPEGYMSPDHRVTIESGNTFRAPLSWFTSEVPLSLYMESKGKLVKIFSNIYETFSYKLDNSSLRRDDTKVLEIENEYFTAVDVHGYKCLPEIPEDNPLQFLLSFNPPLKVTNYNFLSFDIREAKKPDSIVAAMAPKESSYINQFNTMDFKQNIKWTFYDGIDDPYSTTTNNFSVLSKMNAVQTFTYYQELHQQKMQPKTKRLEMELRFAYYLELPSYEENFEFRSRKLDITSAAHLMIFPKYMVINKTPMNIMSENQVFAPKTNEYFNTDSDKVKFKIPGYKQSQSFEIKTIGMAGSFEVEIERPADVQKDSLPQQYIPQKLELGIQIKSAPTPFNKTTLIYLVPRYVVVNQLGSAIVIKQQGGKEQVLVQGQQLQLTLEQKTNKTILVREAQKMEIVGVRQGRSLFQDMLDDTNDHWSSPFSIEDVDDFQINFLGEQQQINDPQWYLPSRENKFKRFARVVVTSQDEATILIVISNPLSPEYEIVNKTDSVIRYGQIQESAIQAVDMIKTIAQMAPNIVGSYLTLNPHESQPYVWADKTKPLRRMMLNIDGKSEHLNIDNALKQKEMKTSTGRLYHVDVRIIGNAKRIEIKPIDQEIEQLSQASLLQDLIKKYQGQQFTIGIDLQGVGFSFVDDQPRELLYLSVYKIGVTLKQHMEVRAESNGIIEIINDIKLSVKHLQLDNSINQIMPVILAPIKPLVKKENNETKVIGIKPIKDLEETKDNSKDLKFDIVHQDEAETPFIQVNLCTVESKSKSMTTHVTSIRAFQVQMQEFIFQVETSIINNNLKFVEELIHTFIDQKEFQVILASFETYEKHKGITRSQVCPLLDANTGFTQGDAVVQSNKMFMKYLHLGAIKANVTFRLEKKAVEIDITNPQKGFGALNVLYSFLSGIASFSNSPLYFKELIILDTFTSVDNLTKQLGKNYATQGIRQFYKIIGSSDLIGNPIGLVDKLGTGVIEFFNEPRKGLLQGPEQFIGGVGKGVQSLASNVVSGSMDSVSKITGSLYSVLKNVAGEEKTEIKKPDHVFDGIYQGMKGGVTELFGGVTGLFTKPVESTKKEGMKGLFKGLGSGLLGAISAPVTATLRAGSSISQGVASTAQSLGNVGKVTIENVQNTRYRPPRYISAKGVLENYNEDLALVRQTLVETHEGRYANQDIKYFCSLPETKPNGEYVNKDIKIQGTVLVITDQMLLYIKESRAEGSSFGKIQTLFKCKLKYIQKCEVFKQGPTQQQMQQSTKEPEARYMLVITWYSQAKGQHKYAFSCQEYQKFEKVYNLLSLVPQVEAVDGVKQRKEKAARFCS